MLRPCCVACLVLCCAAPVISGVGLTNLTLSSSYDDPTPEMARKHGYKCETHEVVTKDGYVLSVHRLPGGRARRLNSSLTPVFLQHGLLCSSADWLISGPVKGLGYILADQGYDVWMGNARGNIYSRKHKTLNPSDRKFWDFTWHEMGYYDLPAVIDHILNVTGHTQVYYVGHSMGTTMFYVMGATRPEYNAKVRYMASLAPIAYMSRIRSPIRYLAHFTKCLEVFFSIFGHGEFLPSHGLVTDLMKFKCLLTVVDEYVCEMILFVFCGFDSAQFDMSIFPQILGHDPAGTSTRTLIHYGQEIVSGKFGQFDYGKAGNLLKYNMTTPPQYNLSRITVPITLLCGDNDLLSNIEDVQELYSSLPNKEYYAVPFKGWNHIDFLWGRTAPMLVYSQVEKDFKLYANRTFAQTILQ